jgi:hypothetical protein
MHLAYEPLFDQSAIEIEAERCGDLDGRAAGDRRYARVWLQRDVEEARKRAKRHSRSKSASTEPAEDLFDETRKLPAKGMQVHFEYTVYAHFLLLKRLLRGARKIRIFMDEDRALRAGCVSAFVEDIVLRRVDAFYVAFRKGLTVDDKRALVRETKRYFDEVRARLNEPDMPDWKVRWFLLTLDLRQLAGRADKWVWEPANAINEPEKRITHLTDFDDYDLIRQGFIYMPASLYGVDRLFMQVRRMLMMLERPIPSAGNVGRLWHGYTDYNSDRLQTLLDIYWTYYNYRAIGGDKRTPAMRLGLAKGPVRLEDILYFRPPA